MRGVLLLGACLLASVVANDGFSCNFDQNLCGFTQSKADKFDWTRKQGSTPSSGTGPGGDHTMASGTGYYVYIETSYPRRQNDNAKLEFKAMTFKKDTCLKFYYHMLGYNVKTLNVFVGSTKVFTKTGQQGYAWREASVRIPVNGVSTLMFEGIRGSSWKGDIAIDDVTISSCSGTSPPIPSTQPATPPPLGNCGIRPSTRIVGGTEAKHGDWPWQAQLRTSSGFCYCGGALVAPQWIVTASHCLSGKSARSVHVRLGALKRSSRVGTEQDFRVIKLIKHPNYHRPVRYANDIALLKLNKPAIFTKNVHPVCLPYSVSAPADNQKCWATGWGTLSSGGSLAQTLMQVSLPVVSRARCDRSYPGKIHDSMICAGLDKGGKDACQGDSGGPLVCETGGRFYLHGATSWGYGCARAGKFGVYAKVKYELNWIMQVMATS